MTPAGSRSVWATTALEDAESIAFVDEDNSALSKELFNAFYTTKSHGMGLGLSVSRSIIERHHGRLWAEPNHGPGATFSFSIPRGPEAMAAAAPAMRQ